MESDKTRAVRAARTRLAIAWAIVVGAAFGVLVRQAWLEHRQAYVVLFALYAPILVAMFGVWPGFWRTRAYAVRVDDKGLWLNGVLALPREAIGAARVVVHRAGTFVRMGRGLSVVEVEVEGRIDGGALLRELGLPRSSDPTIGVSGARFLLGWGSFRGALFRATLLGLTALVAIALIGWRTTEVPLAVAVVFLLLGLRDAAFVTVGDGGILVRRLLARARFVPYGAIAAVEVTGKDVRVRLLDGAALTLHDARFRESPLHFARAVARRAATQRPGG